MNNKLFTYLLGIMFIIVMASGCLDDNNDDSNYPYYEYEYLVDIIQEENEPYNIRVPILINEGDGNISPIMNSLIIIGNGSINFIETVYGMCLEINGSGNLKIKSSGNENVPYAWLNLYNASFGDGKGYGEYWIYFHSINNSSINILVKSWIDKVYNEFSGKGYECSFRITINQNGWNMVEGTHSISEV